MAENRKWGVHAWVALLALGGSWSVALGQSGVVEVEVGIERNPERIASRGAAAVRDLAQKLARSTESARGALSRAGRYHPEIPLSFPTVVRFRSLGSPLQTFASQARPPRSMGPEADLNLVFDSSGPRVFPTQYKQLLIDTFNQAKSTLNTVFGQPSIGGDVYVRNFDADIGDRHAVTGGYFVPDNGAGEAEIRFPVYSSQEAASVNFVHCLLLAYLGPNSYAYDAFQEGLVRAAVMRVVRTAGALPVYLDSEVLGFVLENTYDVGPHYDGFNQRPLGGPSFIAPNLVSAPLPAGGSRVAQASSRAKGCRPRLTSTSPRYRWCPSCECRILTLGCKSSKALPSTRWNKGRFTAGSTPPWPCGRCARSHRRCCGDARRTVAGRKSCTGRRRGRG